MRATSGSGRHKDLTCCLLLFPGFGVERGDLKIFFILEMHLLFSAGSEGCQPLPCSRKPRGRRHPEHLQGSGEWGRDRNADKGWNVPATPHPTPALRHPLQGYMEAVGPGSSGPVQVSRGSPRCRTVVDTSSGSPAPAEWSPGSSTRAGGEWTDSSPEWKGLLCPQLWWQGIRDPHRCDMALPSPIAPPPSSPLTSPGLGVFDLCFPEKEGSGPIPGVSCWSRQTAHTQNYQPRSAWAQPGSLPHFT